MAKITFFNALGNLGLAFTFYDAATLKFDSHTATSARMQDADGAKVLFTGTNLTFKKGVPTGGTITDITLLSDTGATLTTVSNARVGAAHLYSVFKKDGLLGVELDLIGRSDRIFGSDRADYMLGGGGNDMLYGGKGKDQFAGGVGDDSLFGGGGADTFYFGLGEGTDKIYGFHDTGPEAGRDHIGISADLFAHLVMQQQGNDVDLSFGGTDHIILKNFQVVNVDPSDFTIS
jgi:Ca2+-binding RTX toxin-like protein